jgi:hypothetical protein
MRWLRRRLFSHVVEEQLDAELRFHLDQQIAEYVVQGISPEEAHRRAQIDIGGVEQVKQKCPERRWENHVASVYRDIRIAMRSARKDRRFALLAILSLALGIGATTLIFSLIDSVLLHPFPYTNTDRLVGLSIVSAQRNLDRLPVSAFLDFKEQNHVFEDMIGLSFAEMHYLDHDAVESRGMSAESALMLVAARLRYVAATRWGTKRCLQMNRLAQVVAIS